MTPLPRTPRFGVSLVPEARALAEVRRAAAAADELGLDLVAIQDHPYVDRFLDAAALIADLLARTARVHAFPDVFNLALRPPAMTAKLALSLQELGGGRFELGVGSGAFAAGVEAMGGPARSGAEAVDAFEEALAVLEPALRGRPVRFAGTHHRASGFRPGPPPVAPVPIWIGSVGPRMLRLTGRLGDGWAAPIPKYLPYERWPEAMRLIDAGARAAGRDPAEIARMAQTPGLIATGEDRSSLVGDAPILAPVDRWVDVIAEGVDRLGFDTWVFWPLEDPVRQTEFFAREVVPRVRERLDARAAAG